MDSHSSQPEKGNAHPPHLSPFEDDDGGDGDSPNKKRVRKVKESIIDHTYRDYSLVQITATDDDEGQDPDQGRKELKASVNFPAKLHAILSNPSYRHIICWMPHGRSWNIIDKYLLTSVILPKHFAHSKFESFNRSVNGWGFKRLLREGPDKRTYYHECFLRGRPELTGLMQRLCNSGKRLPDKSGEPNFYEISKKYPLPELPSAPPSDTTSKPQSVDAHASQPRAHQFAFPPPHANGSFNMYGYPQSAPSPRMPSSAVNMNNLPKQPQQYLPGHLAPNPFHPNLYGFYPYPHMMMAPQLVGAGPQGYFLPYQPPQFFSQPESPRMAKPHGLAGKLETTAVLYEGVKPAAQAGRDSEKPVTASV